MPQRPARPGRPAWPSPRPAEPGPGERTDEVDPSSSPTGTAQRTDQWRRYGLAEGMRKQAESKSAGASPPVKARAEAPREAPREAPAPARTPEENLLVRRIVLQLLRGADTANKRVQQLERVVDIQAARIDELTRRIDRLERG